MANYRLTNTAKEDLKRIYTYGVYKFGEAQAERYFNSFFQYFETIAERPFSFEAADYIKTGYRRCVCGADSIYFRIKDDQVEIVTIVGRQDFTHSILDEREEDL